VTLDSSTPAGYELKTIADAASFIPLRKSDTLHGKPNKDQAMVGKSNQTSGQLHQ
jgi:hypothetical protein